MKTRRRKAPRKPGSPKSSKTPVRKTPARRPRLDPIAAIAHFGLALAHETDVQRGLEHMLTIARQVTGAEAGTIYVRRGEVLEFAAVQNDVLAHRLGEGEARKRLAARPLPLRESSIASYVVLTRSTVNLQDADAIPEDRPYTLCREVDRTADYRTRSMLAMPLRDVQGRVFGVLQLTNALDARRRVGAFSKEHEALVQSLAGLAAILPGPPPA